jgi:hypothetical protein
MEAYAMGITCLVEFPLYLLFCIRKKSATQLVSSSREIAKAQLLVVLPRLIQRQASQGCLNRGFGRPSDGREELLLPVLGETALGKRVS